MRARGNNLVQTCSLGYKCAVTLRRLSTWVTIYTNGNVWLIGNKTSPTREMHNIDDYTIATVDGVASLLGPTLTFHPPQCRMNVHVREVCMSVKRSRSTCKFSVSTHLHLCKREIISIYMPYVEA